MVPFEASKISVAITKAFLAVEGGTAAASSRIHETVAQLTELVEATFMRRMPSGGTIHMEDIQDQVELALMRSGEHKVARDYVIYREQQAQKRAAKLALPPAIQQVANSISVVQADGSKAPLDIDRLHTIVSEACFELSDVSEADILDEALKNLYDGVSQEELSTSLVITARTMIEQEPNYSFVAARLLCDNLRSEALSFLAVANSATQHDMADSLRQGTAGLRRQRDRTGIAGADTAGLRPAAPGRGPVARARPAVHLSRPADPVRPLLYS